MDRGIAQGLALAWALGPVQRCLLAAAAAAVAAEATLAALLHMD